MEVKNNKCLILGGRMKMKITKESLEKRVDQNLIVSEDMYSECLLDMVHILYIELSKLLDEEERYFGIITEFMETVQIVYDGLDLQMEDQNDYDIYGRCMYLYKPMIYRAYKKLRKKKVSKADCIIVIIKSLLDNLMMTSKVHLKEIKKLQKIASHLFNNIRNLGKNSGIGFLIESINYYRHRGELGLYSVETFSIEEEETKREKTVLEGSGVRIKDTDTVSEITFFDE